MLALFVSVVGVLITVFFAIGAMLGAMITMYASVASRGREVGVLRAIGFSRGSVLGSFLLESAAIALLGGVVGTLASLGMGAVRFSVLNFATFSEIVFRFTPTPGILVGALVAAVGMGLLGGFLPAFRAARAPVVEAIRGA
jgi:putative ABC transport system permease protein